MSEAKFGENFSPDAKSRLDIFKTDGLPEYVEMSRSLRRGLEKSVETEGWPECPSDIEGVEDLFQTAKDIVTDRWSRFVSPELEGRLQQWAQEIPDGRENEEIRSMLSDPKAFEENLRLQQFGTLESLRQVAPQAWRALVLASSERQLASVVTLRHWMKELPPESFERMGITKPELQLFIDFAGVLGKYIDHAYVKQIELADAPGGSTETKLGQRQGAEYLYDIYTSPEGDDVDIKPYTEIFPNEWPKIVKHFKALADKVDRLLAREEIPSSKYQGLPDYLRSLAEMYGSQETEPQKLYDAWQDLYKREAALAQDGCPIMIIPQGSTAVAGEAGKVDVEIRLGLMTERTRSLEKSFNHFREAGQKIVDQNQDKLEKPYQIPKVILNVQPFAFGPNLYWMTRGEEGEEAIVSHINAVEEVAAAREIPLLEKMLGVRPNLAKYKRSAVLEVGLHEMGHTVLSEDDKAVHGRIGVSSEATIVEELKAETVSMKILREGFPPEWQDRREEVITSQFLAKLGTVCDYLANKSSDKGSSGERYYYAGIAIIDRLLNQEVLIKKGDRYEIADAQKGIEVLGQLGSEILESFYTNTEDEPREVKKAVRQFGRDARKRERNPQVQEFLQVLKS